MAGPNEDRIRHFYRWERRGRGWQSFPYPVRLEPSFVPFRYLRELKPPGDDGKHPTALSRFLERFSGKRAKPAPAERSIEEAGPEPFEGGARRELVLLPPRDLVSTPALMEAWLKSLSTLQS